MEGLSRDFTSQAIRATALIADPATMANTLSSGLLSSVLNNIDTMVEGARRSPIPVNASNNAVQVRNIFFIFDLLKPPASSR